MSENIPRNEEERESLGMKSRGDPKKPKMLTLSKTTVPNKNPVKETCPEPKSSLGEVRRAEKEFCQKKKLRDDEPECL